MSDKILQETESEASGEDQAADSPAGLESIEASAPAPGSAPVWRQLLGISVACFGLALLALGGIGGDGWLGLRWMPLLLPLAGYALATVPAPWGGS